MEKKGEIDLYESLFEKYKKYMEHDRNLGTVTGKRFESKEAFRKFLKRYVFIKYKEKNVWKIREMDWVKLNDEKSQKDEESLVDCLIFLITKKQDLLKDVGDIVKENEKDYRDFLAKHSLKNLLQSIWSSEFFGNIIQKFSRILGAFSRELEEIQKDNKEDEKTFEKILQEEKKFAEQVTGSHKHYLFGLFPLGNGSESRSKNYQKHTEQDINNKYELLHP